ncbi:MAG: indole-3-glycerol-phosphate synthase, partial [Saprospiraceae bacterium]|nr:indole-3-glycerol-phosphate synthase [Saprospiraceae bacterium]
FNFCPILRKDFIIDEYQITEARSIGADAILLIAAVQSPERIQELARFAQSLGLEVLLEIHGEEELGHICDEVDVVGVNNRNLKDFSVSLDTSLRLFPLIPDKFVRISESGISKAEDLARLKKAGFDGFLIGGYFMSQAEPPLACKNLIRDTQAILNMQKARS